VRRDPDIQLIKADPLIGNLHNDPRFQSFLRKMNLAE
jgi:hypothetical protein